MKALWFLLDKLSQWQYAVWQQPIAGPEFLVSITIFIFLILLPHGFPGRYFSLIFLLPWIYFKAPNPTNGNVWVTVLDIGQGLAVFVQTTHHALLYDTGIKFNESYDMGESVIIPFLQQSDIKQIDTLIVSHGDNDHAGGANTLLNHYVIKNFFTSIPKKFPNTNAKHCYRGMKWHWDGIDFTFLAPNRHTPYAGNNSSCVLLIDNGWHRVLIPGDIEKEAEESLIKQNLKMAADVLIAPHHGSKTSSSLSFVEQVKPQYVVFSVGYRNMYHFPHKSVVETYRKLNIPQITTAETGAITFEIGHSNMLSRPRLYRVNHHFFWYR